MIPTHTDVSPLFKGYQGGLYDKKASEEIHKDIKEIFGKKASGIQNSRLKQYYSQANQSLPNQIAYTKLRQPDFDSLHKIDQTCRAEQAITNFDHSNLWEQRYKFLNIEYTNLDDTSADGKGYDMDMKRVRAINKILKKWKDTKRITIAHALMEDPSDITLHSSYTQAVESGDMRDYAKVFHVQ